MYSAEVESQIEAEVKRRLRNERPLPADACPDKYRECRQAGTTHEQAIEAAQQQRASDLKAKAEAERKESDAREALKQIQVQAQALLDVVTSAIGNTGH